MFNFGIGEQLAVKLTASYHNQGEGYYDNLVTDAQDGEIEYTMYGAHLLWTPLPTVDVEYSYTREEYDQDTPPLLNVAQPDQLFCSAFGFCAVDIDTPSSGDRYEVEQNGPNDASFDADTHTLQIPGYSRSAGVTATTRSRRRSPTTRLSLSRCPLRTAGPSSRLSSGSSGSPRTS